MAAGIQITGAQIQNVIGSIANDFERMCQRVDAIKQFSDSTDFKVAPYSVSSADEATLKSAVTTLSTAVANYRALPGRASFVVPIIGFGPI